MNNPKDEIYQKFPVIGDSLAFNDISNEIAKDISRSCKSHHFSIGDYLCRKNIIPSEILIISEGEARLIGEDQGKIITLEKLGPGSFIGLASFLRAAPCEEIIVSSELKAITFPDRLILKLIQERKSFFKWCTSTIFTAEIAHLVSLEFSNYPLNGFSWDDSGNRTDCSWFGFMIGIKPNSKINKQHFANHLDAKKINNRMLFGGNLLRQPVSIQQEIAYMPNTCVDSLLLFGHIPRKSYGYF